jgi:hypothetical protein
MTLHEAIGQLEAAGGAIRLDGERVKVKLPPDYPEAELLLTELRQHREEVAELLRQRTAGGQNWPLESLDYERRFAQPHAKLFPFIGRKVRTLAGPGTLLQVFADRATVLLGSELKKCSCFAPGEIEPVSWEL